MFGVAFARMGHPQPSWVAPSPHKELHMKKLIPALVLSIALLGSSYVMAAGLMDAVDKVDQAQAKTDDVKAKKDAYKANAATTKDDLKAKKEGLKTTAKDKKDALKAKKQGLVDTAAGEKKDAKATVDSLK